MPSSENDITKLEAEAWTHLNLKTKYEALVDGNKKSKMQFQVLEKKVQSLIDAFGDWQQKKDEAVRLEKDVRDLEATRTERENAKREYEKKDDEYQEEKEKARARNKELAPKYKGLMKDEIARLKKRMEEYLEIEKKLPGKQVRFTIAVQNQAQAEGKMKRIQTEIMNWTSDAISARENDRVKFEKLASNEDIEYRKVGDKLTKKYFDKEAEAKDLTKEDSDRRAMANGLYAKLKEAKDEEPKITTTTYRKNETVKVKTHPKRAKIVGEAPGAMQALIKRIWRPTPSDS